MLWIWVPAVLEKKRNEEVEERKKLREENAGRRQEVIKRLKQKMEEDWKASNGEAGTGKDGTAPKMPKFNPTPAQINAELETLISVSMLSFVVLITLLIACHR